MVQSMKGKQRRCPFVFAYVCLKADFLRKRIIFFHYGNHIGKHFWIILSPTLKKLMGHIAFGACVRGCVRHTFCTYCIFKPLKLES